MSGADAGERAGVATTGTRSGDVAHAPTKPNKRTLKAKLRRRMGESTVMMREQTRAPQRARARFVSVADRPTWHGHPAHVWEFLQITGQTPVPL